MKLSVPVLIAVSALSFNAERARRLGGLVAARPVPAVLGGVQAGARAASAARVPSLCHDVCHCVSGHRGGERRAGAGAFLLPHFEAHTHPR